MDILTIENLSFTYPNKKTKALDNINLNIKEGDFIVICGESGCGKTTLLKLIKRELSPHGTKSGNIYYRGQAQELLDDRTAACQIGFVMQNPENQIVTDKVWHELAFGLENMGLSTPDIRRRIGEMANFFGIQNWFRKDTSVLSGGQKQLLNLAAIMVMRPDVLILDEPTSQLDPIAATDFIQTLVRINHDMGLTIVLSEHRLEEVFPVADKICILKDGKRLMMDTPRKVGENYHRIDQSSGVEKGFPSALRIYQQLGGRDEAPLTVKEGREFLEKNFSHCRRPIEKTMPALSQKEEVISLKGVWFRYLRDMPDILENINLSVQKGEILSLLGGNGSGKTTLLNVIAGVNRAYKGKVTILEKKIRDYRDKELYVNNLALLPQNPQTVFIKETIRQDYEEIARVMEKDREVFRKEIDEVAEYLNISSLLDIHPYDLSGGEQQKVAFGKMLLLQPKIILMDEPTKGLDAGYKQQMGQRLLELKERNITIVMVTHDVEFSAEFSDRCGLFFDGTVTALDTPKNFFKDNSFYTTAANRISRGLFEDAVTVEEVVRYCQLYGEDHG